MIAAITSTLSPSATFFACYKCSQPTMSLSPIGLYCQGCGLRSFTGSGEQRTAGQCASGHSELAKRSSGATRCLVCSAMGGAN
jgi:hypothetical protein